MKHNHTFKTHEMRMRAEWANALAYALGECHPEDAAAICAAYLETVETGGPLIGDPFGITVSDASLWATAAPPHELVAYTLAGLDVLRSRALGIGSRKRLIVALWGSLPLADRQSFLSRVDADGQFQKGAE